LDTAFLVVPNHFRRARPTTAHLRRPEQFASRLNGLPARSFSGEAAMMAGGPEDATHDVRL